MCAGVGGRLVNILVIKDGHAGSDERSAKRRGRRQQVDSGGTEIHRDSRKRQEGELEVSRRRMFDGGI